jgi:hypothetical protein
VAATSAIIRDATPFGEGSPAWKDVAVGSVRTLRLAAMAGGAGLIAANVLMVIDADARGFGTAGDVLTMAVLCVAVSLTLLGLVGVHVCEREVYGKVGRAALGLALVGQAAGGFANVRLNEWGLLVALAFGLVGFVLLTIAIARAPVLPAWSGYLLLVGWLGLFAVGDADFGIALDGVAWLVVGATFLSRQAEISAAPVGV